VGLPPRDLAAPVERAAGLAPGGAPGYNHCLSCGDCVEACEHATRKLRGKLAEKAGGVPVAAPLTFGWTVNSADSSPQRTPGS
jgi:ferredoxin